ncbi:hypothetical protein J5X84_32570 [Streptosporangiaceae bacterium NEAU-GS5]|nr:hypothetical protein [Streptosporangiaceae bacterium NEAU-GS5]
MRRAHRTRQILNYANLSTPAGLLIGRLGGGRAVRHETGLVLVYGCRLIPPRAGAFTVGSVVMTKRPPEEDYLSGRLLAHEARHAWQWSGCVLVPLGAVLYLLALTASYVICGDPGSWNVFERMANLEDGGYARLAPWWSRT